MNNFPKTFLAALVAATLAACTTNRDITTAPIRGVEDALRLQMTRPTAEEWEKRVGVTPVELPDGVWRVTLSDGQLFYKLSRNRIGAPYIEEIYGISDDPDVAARIKPLQKAISQQTTNSVKKAAPPPARIERPRGARSSRR